MFTELPAGSFTISATRTGFLPGTYGRMRPDGSGRALDLQTGERVTDAVIHLWRHASISGTVIDDHDDPVPYVTVQALMRSIVAGRWQLVNTLRSAQTDARGVYRIAGLMPGQYALVITASNSTIPMSLMSVAYEERLAPTGQLLQGLRTNGTMGYANDLMQGFPVVRVGDFMLQTSSTQVGVLAGEGAIESYPTVWHPAAPTAVDAALVTVAAGDDRRGVDVRPTLTKTVRVTGVVTGPDGPVAHLALSLAPARLGEAGALITGSRSSSMVTAFASSDAAGDFTFMMVPPGDYVIRVLTTPPPIPDSPAPSTVIQRADGMASAVPSAPTAPPMVSTDPTLWAAVPVSVGASGATGVHVSLRPGLRVSGRAEFLGAAPPLDGRALRSIRIWMDPADGRTVALPSAYQGQIDPNGRFYTLGLVAGQYVLRVDNLPRGWMLKSAMAGTQDISDMPLTLEHTDVTTLLLTFTDRMPGLEGSVRDSQGRPDPDATVIVFPTDGVWVDRGPMPRRIRSARTSRTGDYSFGGVPPGEYFVAALNDAIALHWQEPAFLQRVARTAPRVTVRDAQVSAPLTTMQRVER
jgi:protocatechuate 3,4-dioxygenase beta subunit